MSCSSHLFTFPTVCDGWCVCVCVCEVFLLSWFLAGVPIGSLFISFLTSRLHNFSRCASHLRPVDSHRNHSAHIPARRLGGFANIRNSPRSPFNEIKFHPADLDQTPPSPPGGTCARQMNGIRAGQPDQLPPKREGVVHEAVGSVKSKRNRSAVT